MPDSNDSPSTPQWWPQLRRAVLAACVLVTALWFGIEAVLNLPGKPYNLDELLVSDHPRLSAFALACFVAWSAAAPFLASRSVARRRSGALLTGPLAVLISLVAFFFLRFAVTTESLSDILGSRKWALGADWEFILRFLPLHGGITMLMIVAGVTARGGAEDRTTPAWWAMLWALPLLAVCHAVVIGRASTDNLTELIASDLPVPGTVFILAAVFVVAVAGYRLVRLLRGVSASSVARAVVLCVVAGVLAFGLAWLGFENEVRSDESQFQPYPALRFLLARDRMTPIGTSVLFGRFMAVAAATMVLLGISAVASRPVESLMDDLWQGHPEEAPGPRLPGSRRTEAQRPEHPGRLSRIALVAYVFLLLYGYLVPFEFRNVTITEAVDSFTERVLHHSPTSSRSDIVTNILIYIPMMFLAMGVATREGTRGRWWPLKALVIVCLGLLWSFFLEFLQVLVQGRTPSVHDVVSMTIGGFIGIGLWLATGRLVVDWVHRVLNRHVTAGTTEAVLVGFIVVSVLYQLLPFYPTIRLTEIYRRYTTGSIRLLPFNEWLGLLQGGAEFGNVLYAAVSKTLIMVPVGYLFFLRLHRRRDALLLATGWGLVFALALEMLHAIIPGHIASSTDVIYATTGAALGAWLATRFGPVSRRPAVDSTHWRRWGLWWEAAALGLLLTGLAFFKWWPFEVSWPTDGVGDALLEAWRVPFFHQYYQKGSMNLAEQMLREAGWFTALGLLVQAVVYRASQRPARAVVYSVMVLMALLMEGGQVVFAKPPPDFTIIFIEAAAGIFGAWAFPYFVLAFVLPDRKKTAKPARVS